MNQHLLTTNEVAERFGVKSQVIRDLIRNERIKASKHGRDWIIEEEEIANLVLYLPGRPKTVNGEIIRKPKKVRRRKSR